jgi:hypothetical protein
MSTELKSQFKELKKISEYVRPDQTWVASNKQKLFQQIENSTSFEKKQPNFATILEYWIPKQKILVPMRAFSVFFVVIGAAVGSWIAGVSAAGSSLPGEVLYNVKLASESTQLALSSVFSSKDNKAENKGKLQLEFAGRRGKEVKELLAQKKTDAPDYVPQTIQKLKDTMKEAQQNLKEAKEIHPENAINLAQAVTKATSNIVDDLRVVTLAGSLTNIETVKNVVETSKIMNETGLQVIQGVLDDKKVVEGATQDQIKQLVEDKIGTIVKRVEENKARAEESKSDIQFNDMFVPLPVTTSTPLKENTSAALQGNKVDENIKKSEAVATEVKELLADNQVKEALEKAKTLNDLASETQKAIAETNQNVPPVTESAVPNTNTVDQNTSTSTAQ